MTTDGGSNGKIRSHMRVTYSYVPETRLPEVPHTVPVENVTIGEEGVMFVLPTNGNNRSNGKEK